MDKKQEASLGRHRTVIDLCDKELDALKPAAAVKKTYANYKQVVTDIIANSQVQASDIGGVATDKKMAKAAAANSVSEVAGLLFNLFDNEGNQTDKAKVNYSSSDLLKTKDSELPQRLADILALADKHAPAAADYGLRAEMLAGAHAADDLYNGRVTAPKLAKGQKKTATTSLAALFKQADVLLREKLLKLFAPYKKTAPDFYARFVQASKIDDAAVRKAPPAKPA